MALSSSVMRAMLIFIRDFFLTVFTFFFRMARDSWTPGINAEKGVFGVSVVQMFILMGILAWLQMLAGTKVPYVSDSWVVRIAALVIYFINRYFLVTRGYGLRFEREFNGLPKDRKHKLVFRCTLILLGVTVFFIYSAVVHRQFIADLKAKSSQSQSMFMNLDLQQP